MGLNYIAVQWNRQKKWYDATLIAGVAAYLVLFCTITKARFPLVTDEILLIRAFGTGALLLLHIILAIGPLCRIDPRFLPLLYNRRHAGVTMFLLALIHAVLAIITYHAGGDANPILSIFTAGSLSANASGLPFQAFGFIALIILFLMAATSHDFWLANLTAPVWKTLHMLVYVAYSLLVLHVVFGVLQGETSPVYAVMVGAGLSIILSLHWKADSLGKAGDEVLSDADEFVDVCPVSDIPEKRARIVCVSGERVAIFKYDGKISAVSNVCQHQNGPLGEGKILNGCITCPWHGYQYLPETGASPPPFVEKVPTFRTQIKKGRVLIHPRPNKAGIRAEPSVIES